MQCNRCKHCCQYLLGAISNYMQPCKQACCYRGMTISRRRRYDIGMTTIERFWAKVDKNGPIPIYRSDLGPCWVWTAATDGRYGHFALDGRIIVAHAFLVGPAPDGLEWDHLCRNQPCVRPTHLEAVTHRENIQRGATGLRTHCPHGHLFTQENTIKYGNEGRRCRTCYRERGRQKMRILRSKLKAAATRLLQSS